MYSKTKLCIPVVLFGLALAGCGGGGGGSSSTGTSSSTSSSSSSTSSSSTSSSGGTSASTQTWEFYQKGTPKTSGSGTDWGPLYALSPSQPTSPQQVDGNSVNVAAPVNGGTISSGSATDEYVARVVYARTDGTVWRVSTDLAVSPPSPTQVTGAFGTVCTFHIGQDFDNPDNARILVGLKGSSACSNGVGSWKIVRLGASPGESGSFPGTPLVGIMDPTDGHHKGWLTVDGGSIKRITESLGVVTPHSVNGTPTGIANAEYLETLANGNVMLNLDGDLYEYEQSTDRISRFGSYTFAVENYMGSQVEGKKPENYVADGTELYFVDDHTLYRTNHSGNTVVTLDNPSDAVEDYGGAFTGAPRLLVTDKRVVWTYPVDDDSNSFADHVVIRNVDKSAGGGVMIDKVKRLSGLSGSNQGTMDRSGGWFFYTKKPTSTTYTSIAYNADTGSSHTYSDAQWVGDTLELGSFNDLGVSVRYAFLVSQYAEMVAGTGSGNLQSFSVASPANLTDLGSVAGKTLLMSGGFGPGRLGTLAVDDGSGGSSMDVVYVEADNAGSLKRVTSSTTPNEIPVVFF